MNNDILSILRQLDFTEYEAKAYLAFQDTLLPYIQGFQDQKYMKFLVIWKSKEK